MALGLGLTHVLHLVLREAFGHHFSHANLLGDAFSHGAAVTAHHGDAAYARSPKLFEGFCGLRTGLILEADPSDAVPITGHEEEAVSGGFIEIHRLKEVTQHALIFEEGGATDEDALTIDERADTSARGLLEVAHLGQRHTGLLGQCRDGASGGVIGKLLSAGGTSQQFGRGDSVEGVEAADGQTSGGQGAGLIEHEGRDACGGFEVGDILDEDAQAGGGAQGGDHRGGGGQDERAGAGHDEDGDHPVEVLGEAPDKSGDD